jgi:hypothetical protein
MFVFCNAVLLWHWSVVAQTSKPDDDAAALYANADKVVAASEKANIMCPANSWMEFTSFPYSKEWISTEKADFAANTQARVLAHQARSIDRANWPAYVLPNPDFAYLNQLRDLANDIADAAVYQHMQGDDPAAIETIKDLLHMADLIKDPSDKRAVRLLVSMGINAMAMDRLNVISAGSVFTSDPANHKDFQISAARDLIAQLLKHQNAKTEVVEFVHAEDPAVIASGKINVNQYVTTAKRCYAERDMAAMSLACHLYKFDNGHWPKSLDDLHGYLPAIPIDPFGDGKQTLGYALIKAALPDGSDRPLVYSRGNSDDGLFIRTDRPLFSYYNGDGSSKPLKQQKHGGEFRDVTSWMPLEAKIAGPTTQELESR